MFKKCSEPLRFLHCGRSVKVFRFAGRFSNRVLFRASLAEGGPLRRMHDSCSAFFVRRICEVCVAVWDDRMSPVTCIVPFAI